ncbi:MAG TPA: argininosuccinate lyase [Terriglobales bacterium]|nr:argininosuccinate lyase [Terriglobales bacterium]
MADKLWGGRFREPSAAAFERFSESFLYDRRLALAEIRGSRAHAQGLAAAGVLEADEARQIETAFDRLEAEFQAAPPDPLPGVEDVHTYVFQRLEALAPAAARKLQTGRSRNEQVALDLRLYLLDQRRGLEQGLGRLLAALAEFARQHATVIIPGYTHLQRAQPVSLGHHALAYAEMLLRDAGRLQDAYARMSVSPLGSGALAGTPYNLDREAAAKQMGLGAITQNSLDAVSDRDFAIELVFVLSLLGVHLSRWAEDWILYSSSEFGWLVLGDAYATGSSLMPQKKNPDALELIRGKSARQVGRLMQLLTLLKGLPLAYNRDLQEDKEPVFDAVDTAAACLEIAAGVVATTGVDAARGARAASDPALLATDLADVLVDMGVPFHAAHQAVGAIVSKALDEGRDFREFTAAEVVACLPPGHENASLGNWSTLTAETSIGRRQTVGGTAVAQVEAQAARIAQRAHDLLG